jgi:hypothetical protein
MAKSRALCFISASAYFLSQTDARVVIVAQAAPYLISVTHAIRREIRARKLYKGRFFFVGRLGINHMYAI